MLHDYITWNWSGFLLYVSWLTYTMWNNGISLDLYDPKFKPDYNKEEEERFVYKTKRGRRRLAEPALVKEGKTKNKAKQIKIK